jgi:hypothetical protein
MFFNINKLKKNLLLNWKRKCTRSDELLTERVAELNMLVLDFSLILFKLIDILTSTRSPPEIYRLGAFYYTIIKRHVKLSYSIDLYANKICLAYFH